MHPGLRPGQLCVLSWALATATTDDGIRLAPADDLHFILAGYRVVAGTYMALTGSAGACML